jgi:3-oxoacyl-[acyl-carrier-protein] synthase II
MSSSHPQRRVVVTGLGVVCPLGNSAEALWSGLVAGRSGVELLTALPPVAGRVVYGGEARQFAGEIDDFGPLDKELKKSIRKALKVMCRESMMAVASAQQAIVDGALTPDQIDPERTGVVFGSDYMLSPPEDFIGAMRACGVGGGGFQYKEWGGAGLKNMNPLWMLNYLPNMPASHVAIFNDLRGPNNSLTMREASSLLAIREAVQTILRGHADRMLAGATGTRIHSFKTVHAMQTEQLANPELPPAEACRPFDADRSGMVVGEGAGVVLLEELEAAKSRGARIYGEIVGTGSSASADGSLNGQREQSLASSARAALGEAGRVAGLDAARLGHVSAHALGTVRGDAEEARSLATSLGAASKDVPVLACKSYFGNLGAGSGAVELIASLLALHHNQLPATLNYAKPDPACPLRVASSSHSYPPGDSFLKLSVTPQGQAAAIVVRRV